MTTEEPKRWVAVTRGVPKVGDEVLVYAHNPAPLPEPDFVYKIEARTELGYLEANGSVLWVEQNADDDRG